MTKKIMASRNVKVQRFLDQIDLIALDDLKNRRTTRDKVGYLAVLAL